jgi:DNA-binding MarR family transcriptional regulator/GNAT superfamily N-acetyltransferase
MDPPLIGQVRRFNRTVTARIGALDDRYLSGRRPLGQARLLWEVGPHGSDVRALRSRLDLDSGYLSRMLRALQAEGLVAVDPHGADARVRTVRLTEAGQRERDELDRRADALAADILRPLTERQRQRLVIAMGDVERLLLASLVRFEVADPLSADAQYCIREYLAELGRRFEAGFDPTLSISATTAELSPPAGLLLVATLQAEPIGCGALKFHADRATEVKRMWISPAVRGLGLGRRLLAELERHAGRHGARLVRLETNRSLTEAVELYRSAGYREVGRFNDEPYADHWFEKRLRPQRIGSEGES